MKDIKRTIFVLVISLSMVGCASFGRTLKEFLGGKEATKKKAKTDNKRYGKIDKKKYKKVTHTSLQEQSDLGADSGSLWIERGQGAYYFHQNTNRLIGDLINVEIEGGPKEQIETKVKVIQSLIDKIKQQKAARRLAKVNAASKGASGAASAAAPAPSKESNDKFNVKLVPTRIVEVLKDGSYRIQGDQTFMIGKRDYKLVVTGIVRQEDFDDQGISAETLLDPKFDIVTAKKGRG